MPQPPTPGSWRLEYNDFEKEVAFAILQNPGLECLDIMMLHDVEGNPTKDRSVAFTRADLVRVILLDEKYQRLLHRKFYFETIAKVMVRERCEFPDAKTVVLDEDVPSFMEDSLIELARTWLTQNGYQQDRFLWGPQLMPMKRGG